MVFNSLKKRRFLLVISILLTSQFVIAEKAYSFSGAFGSCGTSCHMTGIPNGMMGNSMNSFYGLPFFPSGYTNPMALGQIPYFPQQTVWNGGYFSSSYYNRSYSMPFNNYGFPASNARASAAY